MENRVILLLSKKKERNLKMDRKMIAKYIITTSITIMVLMSIFYYGRQYYVKYQLAECSWDLNSSYNNCA